MVFIVEDGTGVDDANAQITVEQYRAHFAARGIATDAIEDVTLQAAIVVATDYLDQRWGDDAFDGCPEHENQCVPFPRTGIYDRHGNELTGIPKAVIKAVAEYARIAQDGPLLRTPTVDDSGRAVIRSRDRVGPIETEREFSDGSSLDLLLRPYPIADRWLKSVLRSGAGSRTFGRRTRG